MTKAIQKVQKGPSYWDKAKRVAKLQWARVAPSHAPSVFIVGAQKGGTSSLHAYLIQHPQLSGGIDKEVHFFDRDDHYARGVSWYESRFISPPFRKAQHYIDATPDYMYRDRAAQRMAKLYPSAKIVLILREPVSRAYSSWNMYRDFQITRKHLPLLVQSGYLSDRENNLRKVLYEVDSFPSFEEAVALELDYIDMDSKHQEPSFVRRGFYMDQIEEMLKFFKKEDLLILGQNELKTQPVDTLNKVLKHIGMSDSDWNFLEPAVKNARAYDAPINPETAQRLAELYKPHNDRLFAFVGKPLW